MKALCKAQNVGVNQFVRCLEDAPSKCSFAFSLGSAHFCNSPHRFQIAILSDRMTETNQKGEAGDQIEAH